MILKIPNNSSVLTEQDINETKLPNKYDDLHIFEDIKYNKSFKEKGPTSVSINPALQEAY
jgi:hypothetical protein